MTISTDLSEVFDIEHTIEEFQSALAKGRLNFRDTVFEKTVNTSIPVRAHYVLAALDTLGYEEPSKMKSFFDYLRTRTPDREQAALEASFKIALNLSTASISAQAKAHVEGLAQAMGLPADSEGTDDSDPYAHAKKKPSSGRVLH